MESITLRGDLLNISVGKLEVVLREGMAARKSKQLGGKTIDIDIKVGRKHTEVIIRKKQ